MTFGDALVLIRLYRRVMRAAWSGHWIALASDTATPVLVRETGAVWYPTTADLLAEDWMLVAE